MGGERASPLSTEQVVAIDGKASRRSRKRGLQALHLVSDFATEARLILGQEACAEKSNELTAIPVLLDSLMLKGVIVTIDAMGTHTNIARAIRDKEADYVLAVKDNQTKLAGSIIDFFEVSETTGWKNTLHSFVLNLFRLDKTPKQGGIYNCRVLAASSVRYRAQLLGIEGI